MITLPISDLKKQEILQKRSSEFDYLGNDSYKGIYWLKNDSLSDEELGKIRSRQNYKR